LRALLLVHNDLTDAGFTHLASVDWPQLRVLHLSANQLTGAALSTLSKHWPWPHLEQLHLGFNRLGDDALIALAEALPPSLTELNLKATALTTRAASAFAHRLAQGHLQRLSVEENFLGDDGLRTLLPTTAPLTALHLGESELSEAGIAHLASLPLSQMRALYLGFNELGEPGLQTLLSAPWISQLTTLSLRANRLDDAAARHLINTPLPNLRWLDLERNTFTDSTMAALHDAFPNVDLQLPSNTPTTLPGLGIGLRLETRQGVSEAHIFKKLRLTFGSHPENDICLPNANLAYHHAELHFPPPLKAPPSDAKTPSSTDSVATESTEKPGLTPGDRIYLGDMAVEILGWANTEDHPS